MDRIRLVGRRFSGSEFHRVPMHYGVGEQLSLEGRLVQFLRWNWFLGDRNSPRPLPLPRRREAPIYSVVDGGT